MKTLSVLIMSGCAAVVAGYLAPVEGYAEDDADGLRARTEVLSSSKAAADQQGVRGEGARSLIAAIVASGAAAARPTLLVGPSSDTLTVASPEAVSVK